jgi:imidazolonepropionase-like amidohydrolase
VIDPTLNVYEGMFTSRPGTIAPGVEEVASWLPAQVRRRYLGGGLPVDETTDGPYRHAFDVMVKMVALLHEKGIPLEVGSDAEAGFGFQRELELRVKAGIPAADVLADATLRSARIMKKDRDLGSVEAGKLADLVVLDADPLADMGAIRRTSLVVKDGVLFDPQKLFAAAGVSRPAAH